MGQPYPEPLLRVAQAARDFHDATKRSVATINWKPLTDALAAWDAYQPTEQPSPERDYLAEKCPKCGARNGDHIIGIDNIVEPRCPNIGVDTLDRAEEPSNYVLVTQPIEVLRFAGEMARLYPPPANVSPEDRARIGAKLSAVECMMQGRALAAEAEVDKADRMADVSFDLSREEAWCRLHCPGYAAEDPDGEHKGMCTWRGRGHSGPIPGNVRAKGRI